VVTALLFRFPILAMPGALRTQMRLAYLLLRARSKARRLWERVTRALHLSSDLDHSLFRFILRISITSSTSQRLHRLKNGVPNTAYPVATERRVWRLWANRFRPKSVSGKLAGMTIEHPRVMELGLCSRRREAARRCRTIQPIRSCDPHVGKPMHSRGTR
jgi:hypothetical protein